jgi:hypothetical protein
MAISFDIKERVTAMADAINPFDSEGRRQRTFDRLVTKVVSKNQQHDDRMYAIQTLCEMDTDQALSAVFRRWDLKADKEREDRAEKEFLADLLAEKGSRILPFVAKHLDRSPNVTWPLQVLARVSDDATVVEEILRVLQKEGAGVSFNSVKKVHLLQLLAEYEDDRTNDVVVAFLNDDDESVRFSAANTLSAQGTESSGSALLARLVAPEEDSNRVKSAILGSLADRSWPVTSQPIDAVRKAAAEVDGFSVTPRGVTRT